MDTNDERIIDAALKTEILRPPRQSLATFGVTNIYYYLVTEPIYTEISHDSETVVREGRVVAERPRVVTPYYLSHLEGFSSEAKRYFEKLIQLHGPNASGLYYTYKNEPKELNIMSDNVPTVIDKLNTKIDESGNKLTSIIKGTDELWDVSLMKFIYEVTRQSLHNNVSELGARGLLNVDSDGVPAEAMMRIDGMFSKVLSGDLAPGVLKEELERWGLFRKYEDRFYKLFRK